MNYKQIWQELLRRPGRGLPEQKKPWAFDQETILLLCEAKDGLPLSRLLTKLGAEVTLMPLSEVTQIYTIPLELFSTVIIGDTHIEGNFDVADIGGLLRRADPRLNLIWASRLFIATEKSSEAFWGFCDSTMTLPATHKDIHRAVAGIF